MTYVGLDLHKKTIQIAVMEDDGREIFNGSIPNTPKAIGAALRRIPAGAKYVIESSSVWRETYRLMTEDRGLDTVLSNPYRTKIIVRGRLCEAIPCLICPD